MYQTLRPAKQPLFLQLVQQAQVSLGHVADKAVHIARFFHQREKRVLHAHPGADGIP